MFVKQKSMLTAVILAAFMFISFVNSSDAQINIIDMYTLSETYNNNSGFYQVVSIETDIAYDTVYWYIGDPDAPDDLQYVGETLGEDGATRAWFYPSVSDCPGHIKGKKYRVAAEAWYYNPDTKTSTKDYETRDFTVFKSMFTTEVEDPPKIAQNVYGYSELTRQYYTGDAIKIDCYVYAYNPDETRIHAWSRFKHFLTGKPTIERDHPNPNGENPQRIGGKYGSYSHSDTLPHYDIDLQKRSYKSSAYVRLNVVSRATDIYFVGTLDVLFDSDDRPYDAPDDE